ncbi:MAG: methyl-accepting chemotaxis protein, partial [Dehalococcoidia bacterium]
MSQHSKSWIPALSRSLSWRLFLPIFVGAVLLTVAGFFLVNSLQRQAVRDQSVKQAESVIAQMLATRSVYTANVVSKIKSEGINASFSPEFKDQEGALPLPATMVHRISDKVNEKGLYRIDLISPWPINPEKGPKNEWEEQAILALLEDTESKQHRISTVAGETSLQFMGPDFASVQACVACHNSHPASPKTDFQLDDMMGALVVEVPLTTEFAAARDKAIFLTLGLMVALATLVAFLIVFLRRVIIKPVKQLTEAAQLIGQGDLSAEIEIESSDEIGQMGSALEKIAEYNKEFAAVSVEVAHGDLTQDVRARSDRDVLGNSFVEMLSGLRNLVGKTKEAAENIGVASSGLSNTAAQSHESTRALAEASQQVAGWAEQQVQRSAEISGSIGDLSHTIDQMAQGSQQQSNSVEQASSIVNQVSRASADVASSAQSAADGARQANEAARSGANMVSQTVEGMGRIRAAVDSASDKIGELGQQSAEI